MPYESLYYKKLTINHPRPYETKVFVHLLLGVTYSVVYGTRLDLSITYHRWRVIV